MRRDAVGIERARRPPDELLPLTPAAFHILVALAAGERHGYAIMQDVANYTGGALRLGPGTLYRSINQLWADGLIAETEERPDPALDDERRRYYRLTDLGAAVARQEAERLSRLVSVAQTRRLLPEIRRRSAAGGAA